MDDLLGEDWKAPPKQQILQPNNPTAVASSYSSLRTTPQPNGSAASSSVNLSRPASTGISGHAKSPFNAPKASTDVFGGLTGLKTQKAGAALSIQERQRQLAEERQRQLREQGALLDSLGSSRTNGTTSQRPVDDEDDILAAFNKDAKVDKSSHFPPPSLPASESASRKGTPAGRQQPMVYSEFEDDDTFGLGGLKTSNGHTVAPQPVHGDDDDILGDLSRPVVPKLVTRSKSASTDEDWDENVASTRSEKIQGLEPSLVELIDMGFPEDTARIALSENGGDVQRAVGWLLQQAHEESKQKAEEQQRSSRPSRSPPRRARAEGRSDAMHRQQSGDKDAAQIAQEYGSRFFKSANSLWKASQKQMAKTVAEFQQERDPAQPKWMQSASSSRETSQPRPQPNKARSANVTNEAALLDMPREDPQVRSSRQSPVMRTEQDRAPATAQLRKESSARASPQPLQDRRPASKLSRQDVEEQSGQAYVSPARRKTAKPKPEVNQTPEPEVDLFSPAPQTTITPAAAPASTTAPTTRPKPSAPPRTIPTVTPASLSTSAHQRKLGTEAFKRGDYGMAHEAYTAALQPLPSTHPLVIVVLSNRSLTALKTGDAKTAVSDADRALDLIGPGLGVGEVVDFGGAEGQKDMRDFYGKALMRKAEALEHMEKWAEAGNAWRLAVEGGVGGTISLRGKDRCERAAKPKAAPVSRAVKATTPARSLGNSVSRPTLPTPTSTAAVAKLREANAAAERADDEKFQLADKVDAQLVAWKGGKADNLRALLQSLDTVLWESAGWKKVGMGDLVMPNKVKVVYMKAIAKVHPDKISQDASTEQRMISAAVFSTLNEAWDKFKKDNNL